MQTISLPSPWPSTSASIFNYSPLNTGVEEQEADNPLSPLPSERLRQESGEFPEEHISVEDDGHRSGGIQSIRLQTRPHARLGNVRLLDPNAIELPRGRRLIGTYWNNVLPFQRASIEFQERIDRGTQRGDFAILPDILCFVTREQYLRHMSLANA